MPMTSAIIVSMLEAAALVPARCRPVAENAVPSACATVFIEMPFMTVRRL